MSKVETNVQGSNEQLNYHATIDIISIFMSIFFLQKKEHQQQEQQQEAPDHLQQEVEILKGNSFTLPEFAF